MIELRHLDVRHLVIEECYHVVNGCTAKCGCIGLILQCFAIYHGRNNMRYKDYNFVICMQIL